MILELNNFRCFSHIKIELPDNGIILLHGTSGIGKTTILKSIYFVLYGREQKCTKYGEKKCSVKLIYKDMIIKRSKNPNHLELEKKDGEEYKKYEDDVAQEIINKIYGDNFEITSYVAQKSIESFISLPLTKKMDFFNKIALKDIDIKGIKERTKEYIKNIKQELNDKMNEIRILNNELTTFKKKDQYDENEMKKEFPSIIDKIKESFLETYIEQENDKREECNRYIKMLREELKIKRIEMNKYEENNKINIEMNSKIEIINKNNIDNIEKIKNINKEIKEDNSEYINKIKLVIKYLNYNVENNKLNEELNKTKSFLINKIKEIYTKIKKEYNEENDENLLDKLNKKRDDLKINVEDKDKIIEELKIKIIELDNEIENLNKIMKCPKCSSHLMIKNKNIELYKDNSDSDILNVSEYKTKLEEYKKSKSIILEEKDKIIKNIDKIKIDINSIIRSEQELKIIEENGDNILKNIKKKIDDNKENKKEIENRLNRELDSRFIEMLLKEDNFIDMDDIKKWRDILEYDEIDMINLLLEIVDNRNQDIRERENHIKRIKEIEKEIDNNKKRINEYNSKIKEIDIKSINNNIERIEYIEKELIEKDKEKELNDKINIEINKYISYRDEINRYDKLRERIKINEEEEKKIIKKLSVSERLLKKINDSEALSITNTLNNINSLINYYINNFFTNNDIQMQLTPYKETSKGDKKSGLDIEIYYNGEKIGIDNLSGGEYDRCLLVLFLSFNSMINSDIILLDESLSSLNGELVEEIIDILKNSLKDKLVLITLHQANTGIFDHMIDVEKLR
jgi:DNA repair exonuclease SbcCD ATPase subunit